MEGVLGEVLLFLLALPWIVLRGIYLVVRGAVGLPHLLEAKTSPHLTCPVGHVFPVHGRWTCACGATYLGHVFDPCAICGMPAGWTRCPTCGLAVKGP